MATKKATTKKKATTPKAGPKAKPSAKKTPPINEALKQGELLASIANDTELTRTLVQSILGSLSDHIEQSLRPAAKAGEIRFCGLKIFRHTLPARQARQSYIPATGKYIDIPAKSAKQIIKVSTLKKIDDIIA